MRDSLVVAIGRRIRTLRKARGLSQARLAGEAGLTFESISRAERGVSEISITSLSRICAALEIDLSVFFSEAKLPKGQPPSPTVEPEIQTLIKTLRGREKKQIRKILAITRIVLDSP